MSNLEERILQTITSYNGWPNIIWLYSMLADDLALSNKFSRVRIDEAVEHLVVDKLLVKIDYVYESGKTEIILHRP